MVKMWISLWMQRAFRSVRGRHLPTEESWDLVFRMTPSHTRPWSQNPKVRLTASLSHLLMELCTLTPDWVTTHTWLWFRGLAGRPPLCTALSSSSSSSTTASTLHCLVPWLCCTLYLHSLKTNKERIERIRGVFLFFPWVEACMGEELKPLRSSLFLALEV